MEIEVKDLMDENELLSHIFLGCIEEEDLKTIKDKFIQDTDWRKESVKLPVNMTIGGVDVNPKQFFDCWKEQMSRMILDKAKEIVADKLGSAKMKEMEYKISEFSNILESWEKELNWEVENPLLESESESDIDTE